MVYVDTFNSEKYCYIFVLSKGSVKYLNLLLEYHNSDSVT